MRGLERAISELCRKAVSSYCSISH
ncbi:hypothetical protein ACNKHU_02405 [Shigella flexneri]